MTKRPSAASKKLLKDLPSQDEMFNIVLTLQSNTDHAGVALTGAAYLENALEALLAESFCPLEKEDYTRMFDGSQGAILGTFSAKIRLAYAIRRIGDWAYEDLLLINDIRNVFAHSLHAVTFENELVTADCRRLKNLSGPIPHDFGIEDTDTTKSAYCKSIFQLYVGMQIYASHWGGCDPSIVPPTITPEMAALAMAR